MIFKTPNAGDMVHVIREIERHDFEPVAIIKSMDRNGHLPNGTAVGHRWMNRGHGSEQTWSAWRWVIEGAPPRARLFEGSYDLTDRDAAIADAQERAYGC